MSNHTRLKNESNDRNYFVMVPGSVLLQTDPYECRLYSIIKMVAGENGECILNTKELALLCGFGHGTVSEARQRLIEKGLIAGAFKKDEGFSQPVWHLSVVDVWEENGVFMAKIKRLKQKIEYMKMQLKAKKEKNKASEAKTALNAKKRVQEVNPKKGSGGEPLHSGGEPLRKEKGSGGETNIDNKIEPEENIIINDTTLSKIPIQLRFKAFSKIMSDMFETRGFPHMVPHEFIAPGGDQVSNFFKEIIFGDSVQWTDGLVPAIKYLLECNPDHVFTAYDIRLAMKNGLIPKMAAQEPYIYDKQEILNNGKFRFPPFLRGAGPLNLEQFAKQCRAEDERVFDVLANVAEDMKLSHETREAWREWVDSQAEYAKKLGTFDDKTIKAGFKKMREAMKSNGAFNSWDCKTLFTYSGKGA